MIEALWRKLSNIVSLSSDDISGLTGIAGCRVREYSARSEIVHIGAQSENAVFVLQGWLADSIVLEDGRRQIVALPMQGDLCEMVQTVSGERGSSLSVLERSTVLLIPRDALLVMAQHSPTLAAALWSDAITDASIRREWIVNMGRRSAHERIGHLMCELYYRQYVMGSVVGTSCTLPLTQTDMADVTGLTPVHINRTLQHMRQMGMIRLRRRELIIYDFEALARSSMFDPAYLYRWPLDGKRTEVRSPYGLARPFGAVSTIAVPIPLLPLARRVNGAFSGLANGEAH